MSPATHTEDGAWSERAYVSKSGRKVGLPVRCPWRDGRYVVILSGLWDRRFFHGIQAGNIAARVGGTVYFVPEDSHFGTVRA